MSAMLLFFSSLHSAYLFRDACDSIFGAQRFTPNAEPRTWQGVTGHRSMIPFAKWKLPIGRR